MPVAAVDTGFDLTPWPNASAPADCTYNQLRGPKVGVMVNYAYHCEAEDPTPSFSACLGAGSPLILQPANPVHQHLIQRYSAAWLEAWMLCDRQALPYLDGAGADTDQKADLVTLLHGGSTPADIASRLRCATGRPGGTAAAGGIALASAGTPAPTLPGTTPAPADATLSVLAAALFFLLLIGCSRAAEDAR